MGTDFSPVVFGHMQDVLFYIFSLVIVDEVLYEPNFSFREVLYSLWVIHKFFELIKLLFAFPCKPPLDILFQVSGD